MREKNIGQLVEELILLGEDAQELHFWQRIFPSLKKEDQQELIVLLEKEKQLLNEVREKRELREKIGEFSGDQDQ